MEKEKFIVQYWGQEVFMETFLTAPIHVDYDCINSHSGYLLLRGISQLTDEEILKLVAIYQGVPSFNIKIQEYRLSLSWGGYINDRDVADYLRSIGILIPFMSMSVQEILDRGFAKIKED